MPSFYIIILFQSLRKNDISDELGSIIDYILDNTDRFIAAKSDYGIVLADKTKVVIEEVEEEED